MIAQADIERARARWDVVAAEVALQRRGRELYGRCPFHVERTPSFSVCPDKGFFHCFGCGAHGSAIDFVMLRRRLDFTAAVRELAGLEPQPAKSEPAIRAKKSTRPDTGELLDDVLAQCEPLWERSAAALYLWSRGLNPQQPRLLSHPALPYHHEGERGVYPALIAPVTASDGRVTALQRIWVVDRVVAGAEDARAPVAVRKKSLGHFGDGAVQLAPAGPILGFAEGVETALAVTRLFRFPCWALCGTARMGSPETGRPPSFWVPPEAETVMLFGDNGATGQAAAVHAAEALRQRGVHAGAHFPDAGFDDFNDQLIGRRAA